MTGSEECTARLLGRVTGALGEKVQDGLTHRKQLWLMSAEQVSGALAGLGSGRPPGTPLLSRQTLDLTVLTTGIIPDCPIGVAEASARPTVPGERDS